MHLLRVSFYASLLLAFLFVVQAAVGGQAPNGVIANDTAIDVGSASTSSSSRDLPDAPEVVVGRRKDRSGMKILYQVHIRAFSHVAAAVTVGAAGLGFDLATPLSNKWNLRAGASLLTGDWNFKVSGVGVLSTGLQPLSDGIAVQAEPRFSTVFTSLDWFPRYGNFRVSPGLTLYNGNHGTALVTVRGGQVISLGDGDYTSDPANPILATIRARFGRKIAPRLTVGWGNMLPREGSHFSFPFEIGVQYVGKPTLTLALSGNSCDSGGDCGPIANDPTTLANAAKEQSDLNSDISPLRFYPILQSGVSYRF